MNIKELDIERFIDIDWDHDQVSMLYDSQKVIIARKRRNPNIDYNLTKSFNGYLSAGSSITHRNETDYVIIGIRGIVRHVVVLMDFQGEFLSAFRPAVFGIPALRYQHDRNSEKLFERSNGSSEPWCLIDLFNLPVDDFVPSANVPLNSVQHQLRLAGSWLDYLSRLNSDRALVAVIDCLHSARSRIGLLSTLVTPGVFET